MGLLNILKEAIINKPATLKGPIFIKEFNEDNKQLMELEELLKVAPEEVCKEIKKDMKLISYGMVGEKNIAYELSNSHMPILILHDLFIEYNGLKAQVDYVVIGQRFILVIECKNMVGDIEITNNGDFIRHFKGANGRVYKKEGMYSPIVQNERHTNLVKELLLNEGNLKKTNCEMIKHIVTVANPKAVINNKYAKAEIKNKIIKHEQLINKMKELHEQNKNGYSFTEENMYAIANSLMKYNEVYCVDYERKYGVSHISKENSIKIKENTEEIGTHKENSGICDEHTVTSQMGSKEFDNNRNNKDLNKTIKVASNLKSNEELTQDTKIEEEKDKIIQCSSIEVAQRNSGSLQLFEQLKAYRLKTSREEGFKPYMVFNNEELNTLIEIKPKNKDELLKVKGFGSKKVEKYGDAIISILNNFVD